jgi:hypothetical protein
MRQGNRRGAVPVSPNLLAILTVVLWMIRLDSAYMLGLLAVILVGAAIN